MATPFPTDLVAAPTGGAIAWVSSNSGVHNILVAEPSPGHRADGWPHRSQVARGDELHRRRRAVDHRAGLHERREDRSSTCAATARTARANRRTRHSCRTAPSKRCLPCRSPVGHRSGLGPAAASSPSPRGQRVAWVSRGQIWSVDLATTEQPARLVNARGSAVRAVVVTGRIDARVHERARHAQLHRRVHARIEGTALHRSVARSRRQRGVVTGRIADRVDPPGRGAARAHVFAAARSRRTVVAARRRREDRAWRGRCGRPMPDTAAPSRASSPTASCIGARAIGWSSHGRRTAGCISIPCRQRREGHAADAGQLRSRIREHRVQRRDDDLQLQPGRHRQSPRLDGAGRWHPRSRHASRSNRSAANGRRR